MINIQTYIINSRFKLPRNNYYFCSRNNLGNLIEAGLPNITGSIGGGYNYIFEDGSGALQSANKRTTNNISITQSGNICNGMNFDASLSNQIYGNNSTIQPLSISCYLEFYIN